MVYKRIITVIMFVFIILGNVMLLGNTIKAEVDTTPPTLNNITVDKKMVTNGDEIIVTVDANDDISGIMSIDVIYDAPSGSATKYAYLSKKTDGKYSGTVSIEQNDASGKWKVSYIILTDNASNHLAVYNSERFSAPGNNGILKDLSSGDFEVSGTISDTTPPSLNNITVDRKMVTSGDEIIVTVDANDDISGIMSIDVIYDAPSGSATKYAYLSKKTDGKYSGTVSIEQNDASGKWKVSYIILTDNASNHLAVYNSERFSAPGNNGILKDLSSGDFEVSGTISDTTPPSLNNITVDRKMVTSGDEIIVTVDANDDISGIKSIDVFYDAPSGSATKYAYLSKKADGRYSGTVSIGQDDAYGKWKVSYIILTDNASNHLAVYNSERFSAPGNNGILKDLSSGDFEVQKLNTNIEPLPQKCIKQNEYWTNNIIDGDLYVGPQAVLTINGSVIVKGNIYVLGSIKNYGNLTVVGGIYAKQFVWGDSTLSNGTVLMLGGNNLIGSLEASDTPIDIPLKIYESNSNTLIAFDGKVSVTGATLPIIDLYTDSAKVNYYSNGTFSLDLDTNNKQQINFKTVDIFGNEKITSYTIFNKYYNTNKDNSINIMDLANVAKEYNVKRTESNWQDQYDYNCDGIIDIFDLVRISRKISYI